MDLNLPSIFTDAQVATFAATIALLVGILQQISWIPLADGSRARAWTVAIAAALFVGLSVTTTTLTGTDLILGAVLAWIALASASLGINRAGSYTVQAVQTRATEPTVSDYDPKSPTGDAE